MGKLMFLWFSSRVLRWKIFLICRGARRIVRTKGIGCWAWWFGAYYINPKHLVVVLAVPSDSDRDRLRTDSGIVPELRHLLQRFRWPGAAQPHVVFDIESEETVKRGNNGNWWYHYK